MAMARARVRARLLAVAGQYHFGVYFNTERIQGTTTSHGCSGRRVVVSSGNVVYRQIERLPTGNNY